MKINNSWKKTLEKKNAERMHKVFQSLNIKQLAEFKEYIEKLIEKKTRPNQDYN